MEHVDGATLRWLIGILGVAIVSLLTATWRTARQSKEAEEAMKDVAALKLHLLGNKLVGQKGVLDDLQEVKNAALYSARVARLLFRAFRIPEGSSEDEVIIHIREAIHGSYVGNTGQHPAVVVDQQGRVISPKPRPAFKPPIKREDE